MPTTVTVRSNAQAWVTLTKTNLGNACGAMSQAILNTARINAPVLTGQLRMDGRVEGSGTNREVKFGGGGGGRSFRGTKSSTNGVPYARRRHFENKKHPGTLHYLQRGGDAIAKKGIKPYL